MPLIKKNATFTKVVCYSVLTKHMLTKHTELFFYLFCDAVKHIITQRPRCMGAMGPRALETLRISLESETNWNIEGHKRLGTITYIIY